MEINNTVSVIIVISLVLFFIIGIKILVDVRLQRPRTLHTTRVK